MLEEEEEEPLTCVEWLQAKVEELMFGWECTPEWYAFAGWVEYFVMDPFVDLFITLCIVVNTVFMAMDNADKSPTMMTVLSTGNYVSPSCFL